MVLLPGFGDKDASRCRGVDRSDRGRGSCGIGERRSGSSVIMIGPGLAIGMPAIGIEAAAMGKHQGSRKEKNQDGQ